MRADTPKKIQFAYRTLHAKNLTHRRWTTIVDVHRGRHFKKHYFGTRLLLTELDISYPINIAPGP